MCIFTRHSFPHSNRIQLMRSYRFLLFFVYSSILLFSCATKETTHEVIFDEIVLTEKRISEAPTMNGSRTKYHDITHMDLRVNFDWNKQTLQGESILSIHPYASSQDHLVLDAKGFDIHEVYLYSTQKEEKLNYQYDQQKLDIALNKSYQKNENYKIFIAYTANPNELSERASSAINGAKGLYFINPKNADPCKMPQIWTQGEPESNSCWFPTIDSPNERISQDLYIRVQNRYKTLSNGLLIESVQHEDGSRTDHWQQKEEHAPYLCMMAIGEFEKIHDSWNDIDVDYYVEAEQAKHAKMIFGMTPDMLQFFSERLGVDYPWDKYAQIIVRDYVSGAMENTSAVIHGEFVYADERKYLDETHEDIVAHELFHHWFGDLVTCESWAQLPLNESFATYGEYLWIEHRYGKDEADDHLHQDLKSYLAESAAKQVDLIRFDYEFPGDMFDNHSYAKGGRILHLLRNYLGDDFFFAGLQHYLESYRNQAVEIHQLRMSFEQVSGEDLNWFFNQWFLSSGHPDLKIEHWTENNQLIVKISQLQDKKFSPIYRLPLAIDIYSETGKERKEVILYKQEQRFEFPIATKPLLVNFDADKVIPGQINHKMSAEERLYQFEHAGLYLDRLEAIAHFKGKEEDPYYEKMALLAIQDKHWRIRKEALSLFASFSGTAKKTHEERIRNLATKDPSSKVREASLELIANQWNEMLYDVCLELIHDPSYLVSGTALTLLKNKDKKEAMRLAISIQDTAKGQLLEAVANVYASYADEVQHSFFSEGLQCLSTNEKMNWLKHYSRYLERQSEALIRQSLGDFEQIGREGNTWFVRYVATTQLSQLQKQLVVDGASKRLTDHIDTLVKDIKKHEKDPQLRGYYN